MISKVKTMLNSSDEIKEIHKELKKMQKTIQGSAKDLSSLYADEKKEHKELMQQLKKTAKEQEQALESIKNVEKEMQSELMQLKVFKTKLRSDTMENISKEIKHELQGYVKSIHTVVSTLEKSSDDLSEISKRSKDSIAVTNDLKSIAKTIQKSDFEFKKYADELRKGDSEKVELLKRIDSLERMIAKMKRNHRER